MIVVQLSRADGSHLSEYTLHAQILLHSNNNNPSMKKDNRELPSGLGFPLSQSIASVSLMQKKGLMPPYTEKLPLKLQVILKQK